MEFSVLMSVYCKDRIDYFRTALESVTISQTVKPNQVVIVKDGRVSDNIDFIIKDISNRETDIEFTVVTLEENSGLAAALNEGLKYCKYQWIARMDADDISVLNRFEIQIRYIKAHPDVQVVGGAIEEFNEQIGDIVSKRLLGITYSEILRVARSRNPINHMTVFCEKRALTKMGGYPTDTDKLEDYKLWISMMLKGYRFENISETMVYSRVGNGFISRRSNKNEIADWDRIQEYMVEEKFIGRIQALINSFSIRCFIYSPGWLKSMAYSLLLRKRS